MQQREKVTNISFEDNYSAVETRSPPPPSPPPLSHPHSLFRFVAIKSSHVVVLLNSLLKP